MSRTNISGSRTQAVAIEKFNGLNTAASFSEIDITQSPKMVNFLPNVLGGLTNRPGTIPFTNSPIGSIKRLLSFRKNNFNFLLVTSGTTLYQLDFESKTFVAKSGSLNYAEIDATQFKDNNANEVLIIADGGPLKFYDGNSVATITPAANDADLPINDLANINTHNPKGCLVHNTRVVIWNGTDTIWHSKIGFYDYFRQTDYQRWVRENDYVQTCVTYRGALIVFMRRHIGVLFGHDTGDWSQDFLDTTDGCIAPKTVQTVTYPNGNQEVFYVSDTGVHSVYAIDTLSLDSSARYSTKNMTTKKINWKALGVTKDEWKNAIATCIDGLYWLIYKKGSEYKGLVFDTNTSEWYPIENFKATDFYVDDENFLLAGEDGYLRKVDPSLYSDWDDVAKTTKTPIKKEWNSKMMTPKLTGHDHLWDILVIQAKQQMVKSTLDVEVNTYKNSFTLPSAVKTAALIWGVTEWVEAEWANTKLTDLINDPQRIRTFLKGQYAQIKLSNDRDEPMEIYGIRYEVRPMDTYY